MGENMGINIIKGVGALFLVFVICFMANIFLSVVTKSTTPNMAVVFAWIGTTPAMFYSGTGFWRRFAASLLGSMASLIVSAAFGLLTGALLSTGSLTESPTVLVIFGRFAVIATIVQLAAAYFVARTVVRRGLGKGKASRLAVA
jgi:hypothetical protein